MPQRSIDYDPCCNREKVVVKPEIKKFDGLIPSTQLK
jgi:hypothetical protein